MKLIKYSNKWINGDKIININKVMNTDCNTKDEYPFAIIIHTSNGITHQNGFDAEKVRDYYWKLLGNALLSTKIIVNVDRQSRKKFPSNGWSSN